MPTSSSLGGFFHTIDGIARLILITLFALLPFVFIPAASTAIVQGKMLFVALLLMCAATLWLIARAMEGAVHVPKSALLYAAALLPIAYLVSTIASGWSINAIVGQGVEQDTLAAVTLWFSTFVLVALLLYGNFAATRLAVQSFIFGVTLLSLFQTLYILFPSWFSLGGLLNGSTTNLFGSWHDLGIMAGLSFFLALSLWHSGLFVGWKRAVLALLGFLSLFLLIAIHFNDVFWATAALCTLGSIAIVRVATKHDGLSYVRASIRAAPFLIAAILLALAAFFGAAQWERLPARINITQTEVRPSWQGTYDVARQSLQAPSSVLFGSGPNSFIREWGLHKPAGVNMTPFWAADFNYGVGIIPTSIFTAGLFGLVAWGVLVIVLLMLFARLAFESRPLSPTRILFGVSLFSAGYLIAYHTIYTPGISITGTMFLMLGVLAVAAAGDSPPRTFRIGLSSLKEGAGFLVLGVLTLATLACAGLVGREVLSNIFVNRSVYAYQSTNDVGSASALINTALRISPRNDRGHRAAAELGVVQLAQLIQAKPEDEAAQKQLQEALQSTIQHGLTAVSINEGNYQNWLLLAQVYSDLAGANIEGSLEAAVNAYARARDANPTNPLPRLRLAQLAVAKGDRREARTQLTEAIALKQDFAAAHFLLSQVEAADGKGEAAVSAASAAVQLVPQDPLGWFNLGYILYAGQAYRNAALALQQAVSLSPDYSNALFFLALSYAALDMPNDATIVLTRVQELNPNETWIPQMIANVKAGKEPFAGIQQQAATQ